MDILGKVETVILGMPDPIGTFGVRGAVEMALIPMAPVVVAAIHDTTGLYGGNRRII